MTKKELRIRFKKKWLEAAKEFGKKVADDLVSRYRNYWKDD